MANPVTIPTLSDEYLTSFVVAAIRRQAGHHFLGSTFENAEAWLQLLKDHTEQIRRETEVVRGEVQALERKELALQAQRRRLQWREKKNAARYRWLKGCKALELHSSNTRWTREDGTTFFQLHQLAEGGTGHAAYETLDETIDAAMLVARERDGEQP